MKTRDRRQDSVVREDELARVQLEIARRADELARARETNGRRYTDRECWLDAERQILARRRQSVVV